MIFLLLLISPLSFADTPSSISSKKAIYEGNALVLKGCVQLDHKLGMIESGHARLQKESQEAPFTSISLRENVKITLQNQSELLCEKADFDFNHLQAILYPKKGESIHFSTTDKEPFSLSSKLANITLSKDQNSMRLKAIEAKESVLAHYGNHFTLFAEDLLYTDEPASYISVPTHAVLERGDDRIEAEQVEVYPNAAKAHLTSPKGIFKPALSSPEQEIQFSCDQLTWDDLKHTLTLQGEIWVEDGQFGLIHCDDEIKLIQKQIEGKWILNQVVANGKTAVRCTFSSDFTPLLICDGVMNLDHDHKSLALQSLQDSPVQYYHENLELSGDQAQIDYVETLGKISAQKLLLTGNVLLTSSEESDEVRLGVADQFTYLADEKNLVLSSEDGNKVLFWDDTQDLSISANEVHILKTEENYAVKGVGNVRFTFSSEESALLKKLFPFYQPKGGSNVARD